MYLSLVHMIVSYLVRRLVPWLVRRNSVLACAGILERRDLADPATTAALIALPPGYSPSPERRLVACYLRYVEPWCVRCSAGCRGGGCGRRRGKLWVGWV